MLMVISLTGLGVLLTKSLLTLFSVISVAIMIERAMTLRRIRRLEQKDYTVLKAALQKRQIQVAQTRLLESSAPCALALQAGLDLPDASEERSREAILQGIVVQSALLQRSLSVLATIASTAPYIGLFGTVIGILAAFREIASTGKTGASLVAGGISEALITTALGLGVAIPAVIGYNFFVSRVNDLTLAVETHTLDLAARLPELQTPNREAAPYESH
jgi:biopolymer transport protein ExbB